MRAPALKIQQHDLQVQVHRPHGLGIQLKTVHVRVHDINVVERGRGAQKQRFQPVKKGPFGQPRHAVDMVHARGGGYEAGAVAGEHIAPKLVMRPHLDADFRPVLEGAASKMKIYWVRERVGVVVCLWFVCGEVELVFFHPVR